MPSLRRHVGGAANRLIGVYGIALEMALVYSVPGTLCPGKGIKFVFVIVIVISTRNRASYRLLSEVKWKRGKVAWLCKICRRKYGVGGGGGERVGEPPETNV